MTNGRARKSLADQIDRLDRLLDGLADGLNEAIADAVSLAVSRAVQEAVQAVLREVLSRPELLTRLPGAFPDGPSTDASPAPERLSLRDRLFRAGAFVVGGGRMLGRGVCRLACNGVAAVMTVGRCIRSGCGRLIVNARKSAEALYFRCCYLLACGWWHLRAVRQLAIPLALATAVGGTVGVASYWSGPWLAGLAGGTGAFTLVLAGHTLMQVRRLLAESL